jgi:hypothetical protein
MIAWLEAMPAHIKQAHGYPIELEKEIANLEYYKSLNPINTR